MTSFLRNWQDRDYRRWAWENGCICPETLMAHTHLPTCEMYAVVQREEDHALERVLESRLREEVDKEIQTEGYVLRAKDEQPK